MFGCGSRILAQIRHRGEDILNPSAPQLSFFFISSNFMYNKACVLPVTKDEMGQINEQVRDTIETK